MTMLLLAFGKRVMGQQLGPEVLLTEERAANEKRKKSFWVYPVPSNERAMKTRRMVRLSVKMASE